MNDSIYRQLIINPAYEAAWAELCDAEQNYTDTVRQTITDEKTWRDISDARARLNAAKEVLRNTEKYIYVE